MMKNTLIKIHLLFVFAITLLSLVGCQPADQKDGVVYNATDYGLSVSNSGEVNSRRLQALIDSLAKTGGTVYIPAGEYEFCENGRQTYGSHCIKMRSGVNIKGDGGSTVLRPVGLSDYGLDMFYFNDYLDIGEPNYLVGCSFEDFVIDASDTSCRTYTSAGKGFMFNLFRDCHFTRVTVINTDATGFGIDCPIDSSIIGCTAIGCGKAAGVNSSGASGFGIGYGYSDEESIIISDCIACGNRKFGFFFEHQGRFSPQMYSAEPKTAFSVNGCYASENLYNFGGICSSSVSYSSCVSERAKEYGFYFESSYDASVLGCTVTACPTGVAVNNSNAEWGVGEINVSDCTFTSVTQYDILAKGSLARLVLKNNRSDLNLVSLCDTAVDLINENNSWN